MVSDVKVKIDLTYPTGKVGFGYPLILTFGEAKEYTECKSLADVVEAGFAATTDTYKAADLMFSQNNPPSKIAVCGVAESSDLSAIQGKDWRQLMTVGGEKADVTAVIAYVGATEDKVYFATVTDATGLKDLGTDERVVGFVHSNALAVAALVGESAGRDAGSFTYKNLILKEIEPMALTAVQIEAIHTANGLTFVTKAGDNVTTEGKNMGGEYIDILDSKDWVIQNLEYETQKVLNSMGKVPYDNNGIGMLESVAVNVLQTAFNNGMIATNEDGTPAYTVAYALSDQVSDANRAARKYVDGQFSFKLAGAIHEVEITGEILI